MSYHEISLALVQRINMNDTVLLLILESKERAYEFNNNLEGYTLVWNNNNHDLVQFTLYSSAIGHVHFSVPCLEPELLNKINLVSTAYFSNDDYQMIELRPFNLQKAA